MNNYMLGKESMKILREKFSINVDGLKSIEVRSSCDDVTEITITYLHDNDKGLHSINVKTDDDLKKEEENRKLFINEYLQSLDAEKDGPLIDIINWMMRDDTISIKRDWDVIVVTYDFDQNNKTNQDSYHEVIGVCKTSKMANAIIERHKRELGSKTMFGVYNQQYMDLTNESN